MLPFDAILFDLDGTLIDSESVAVLAVLECMHAYGVQVDKSDAEVLTGRKWSFAFDFIFKKYATELAAKPRAKIENEIIALYHERLKTDFKTIPGAVEWVKTLVPHLRLAVVSGSSRGEITWALEKMGILSFFERIFGSEDYRESKPSPEGYLKALKELKLDPARTLIFEDSTAGITSALGANVTVVAITAANHTKQDQSHARDHIRDYTGLKLESLSRWSAK